MTDFVALYAAAQPEKPAVIDDRATGPGGAVVVRTMTYRELDHAANQLANVLASHGVGAGSTLVWCGPNSIGVVLAIDAAAKLGATAVPLNYRLADEEAAYITDHSDAELVIVDAEYAAMFDRIRDELAKVRHVLVFDGPPPAADGWFRSVDDLVASAATTAPDAGEADRSQTMIYTSGTTGRPKGAIRPVKGVMEQVVALVGEIGYTSDDVYLTTGPLYHSGPGGFMGIAQALGQTVVVQRKFDPIDWLRLVDTYRCTSTFAAPTPIRMICTLPSEQLARHDRSTMRVMIANAAPWPHALKQRYVEVFPPESLFEVYGSTELGVNTVLRPEDQMRKPGSCGREAPMVEIRLYDDDGAIVTATGPDATGELFVRSPAVFADYYKQHDRFEQDHRDGFQTVGDIAYRDDEGFLYICDRKNDLIITGGMNVYPAEVEAALEQHPDVYESAVFGVPSDEWGEAVHAVVVARPGSSLDDAAVVEHARAHLAGYKVPRSVSWLAELPKTGSGKILKRELRAPFWEGRGARV